jgi:S-adenosylmethionine hydrolase
MSDPIITLTTDFGDGSSYVAAMKGVVLSINPAARIVDLSHRIPPQDTRYAAYFLPTVIPYFPPASLHVVVVDPGVGTERALLYVEVEGQRLLVPDNGCWTELLRAEPRSPLVIRLAEKRFWRDRVSATFHGRDILAPAAAHLSLGLDPRNLGPTATEWARFQGPKATLHQDSLNGEVVLVDPFGNLITNIPGESLSLLKKPARFKVGGHNLERLVRTYGEAEPGSLVALVSSSGMLEIAVNQGNAAEQLRVEVGSPVTAISAP